MSEFHAEAPQATASEGLAQCPYVSARAGLEPATLRTKGDESTNEPPWPTINDCRIYISPMSIDHSPTAVIQMLLKLIKNDMDRSMGFGMCSYSCSIMAVFTT